MRNFILLDFLLEKVKKLFLLIENHNHDDIYVKKEENIEKIIPQSANTLTSNYKIKENHNAVVSGPYEIKGGVILEIPKGSTFTVL